MTNRRVHPYTSYMTQHATSDKERYLARVLHIVIEGANDAATHLSIDPAVIVNDLIFILADHLFRQGRGHYSVFRRTAGGKITTGKLPTPGDKALRALY